MFNKILLFFINYCQLFRFLLAPVLFLAFELFLEVIVFAFKSIILTCHFEFKTLLLLLFSFLIFFLQFFEQFLRLLSTLILVHIFCKHFLFHFFHFHFRAIHKLFIYISYLINLISSSICAVFIHLILLSIDLCELECFIFNISQHLLFLLCPFFRHYKVQVYSLIFIIFDLI